MSQFGESASRGRNHASLLEAKRVNAKTAVEICSIWNKKLRLAVRLRLRALLGACASRGDDAQLNDLRIASIARNRLQIRIRIIAFHLEQILAATPAPACSGQRKPRRRNLFGLEQISCLRLCGLGSVRVLDFQCRCSGLQEAGHCPSSSNYSTSLFFAARSRRCSRVYSSSSETPNNSSITPQMTSIEASKRVKLLTGMISP